MLGAACKGAAAVKSARLTVVDKVFPGMEHVPTDFAATKSGTRPRICRRICT